MGINSAMKKKRKKKRKTFVAVWGLSVSCVTQENHRGESQPKSTFKPPPERASSKMK
jgi:hypothetical protein